MNYIQAIIFCQCGHESHVKIEEGKLPLKGKETLHFNCIFCDRLVKIEEETYVAVLCHTGTNNMAIFDDNGGILDGYGHPN